MAANDSGRGAILSARLGGGLDSAAFGGSREVGTVDIHLRGLRTGVAGTVSV